MSGGLFAFDHYYVPDANRKQDAIRKEIKGKPVQTYLHPDRQWVFDPGSNNDPQVFYFKYIDGAQKLMVGPQVFELDPANFRVHKHISAEKARWEPALAHLDFRERLEPRGSGRPAREVRQLHGPGRHF